jgi:hypothetical protein
MNYFYFNSSDSLTQEELKSMLEDEAINNTPVTLFMMPLMPTVYLPSITQDNWIILASNKIRAFLRVNLSLQFS